MADTPSDGNPQRLAIAISELRLLEDKIDLSPEAYQRFFLADDKWQSMFMASFFNPEVIIPEVALRLGLMIPKVGILAEVMDGCQRVSTIFRFMNNEVVLPNVDELAEVQAPGEDFTHDIRKKLYKELPLSVRDAFLAYQIQAQMYYNLTPQKAGWYFVNVLNNTNTLNAQEKRQAVSSAMSRTVQQWSRFNPLGVFETVDGNRLKWIAKAEHKRLDVDKTLAEIVFMCSEESFKTKGTTGKVINDFYDTQASMFQTKFNNAVHIEKVLKFVGESMKNHATAKSKIALKPFRNYCYMVSSMMKAKRKIDPIEFMEVYIQAIHNLKNVPVPKGLTGTPYELRMRGSGAEDTNVALELLWKEMSIITFSSIQLDSKRTFTREEVLDAYTKQNGICAICSMEMGEFGEHIHGDHVLLYKDGNSTTPDNCDAVHASCNVRK